MREVKPTQKPVPSSDIKDLFFNSGLLDIWATSLEHKYIDRFGNCHLTAAGMEWLFKELVEKFKVDMNTAIVAAGYITIDSFQKGADLPNNELTQRNHILRDETTGEYFRWDGDLPKQVPAGSTPQSTGGIGKGAWVSVGDASFRSDVKNGDGSLIGLDHGTLKDAINYVTPEMFGDTSGDAYDALQKALSSPLPCKLSAKTYRTSKPLYYDSMKVIEGAGEDLTQIVKYTNSKSGLGIININGKPMNYDVDAVLIARASDQNWYNKFTQLSGFTLVREGDIDDVKEAFGLYAPLICQNAYSNIRVEGQCTGIFTVDYWMLSWIRVESFCDAPWVLGNEDTPWVANGTSNVFNACWAHSAKGDNYAWDIRNIMYSEMIGGGTDKIGSDGSPCAGMMRFKNSRMTLSNVGGEKIHATRLVRATDGSIITLNQCDFFNVYNKYAPETITWDNVNVLFQAVGNSTIIFDGTGVNAIYDFDSGLPNISSLAYAVDRSKIFWKNNSRSRPLLQEIRRSAGDRKTKYGITWASSSKVQIHTEGIFIEDESDGTNQNLNTDVKVIENIHSTYRALQTSSFIESKPFELNGGSLDSLRTKGNMSFHSSHAANNTIANGYPLAGGAYFINQTSTGGIGLNTRTIQEAIRTDDTEIVTKWIRRAEWGKPFSKWYRYGLS
ncbi:hypothetical protein [Providencia sp. PROV076]|uniref:tail fiber/spike domain-containing protein n=1 Tax=Providencia sp. PROV076 TaxID=2949798 RepID=UPI0023498239|nr:hypothetical protein [Providencia sp. PROV076]